MRASHQAQAPQPLPLPLPPPPLSLSLPSPSDTPRRRHPRRTASSSSSSSSSSSVSFCPSPSPAASPRASTSLVPFSWERQPGVPKNALAGADDPAASGPLPLPPPLRQPPRRRRRRRGANASAPVGASGADTSSDPFVAAIAECTRDDDDDADDGADADAEFTVVQKLWLAPTKPTAASGRAERRWRLAGGGFVGFLDLYGCKSAMAVADGAFLARRPVAAARAGPGRSARR